MILGDKSDYQRSYIKKLRRFKNKRVLLYTPLPFESDIRKTVNIMRKNLAFVNTRITTEVGYTPPTELEESLRQTLDYYYESKKRKKK